jgi:hypothetical protein
MPIPLNETHDPARRSFVESANLPGSDFPIQNLPFGVFRLSASEQPRGGVAIGDLIGSGTVSGPESSWASLLELTSGGSKPLSLANGEQRTFIENGDEISFRGFCARPGHARIGFGECRATVLLPA